MKYLISHGRRLVAILSVFALVFSGTSIAQRSFGVKSLVLDDNAGHKIQLTAPQPGDVGYAAWIAGGTFNWRVPVPPTPSDVMAFVLPGTNSGQVLSWDVTGVWRPGLLAVGSISLPTGQILVGNGGVGTAVALSGDATIASTGVLTLTNSVGARSHLGAAASGANSDITSIGGLITPLPIAEGGTGASDAATARANLSAATRGANSDITSLSSLTTPLSIVQGGTGANNAGTARANLSAAQSGPNSDITSLSGLTTALPISEGGVGQTSYTDGDILYYNSAVSTTALSKLPTGGAANSGLMLTIDGTGKPFWSLLTSSSLSANYTWTGTHTWGPATDITGVVIKGTTAVGPTADIVDVTASDGTTKYFAVTPAGGIALPQLSASLPLKTDASKVVTAAAINIRSGSAEISGILPVSNGGTGAATLSANGVLVGNGTNAVNVTSAGTAGQVLTSRGAGLDPTFQTPLSAVYAGSLNTNQNQNKTSFYFPIGLTVGASATEDVVTAIVPRACHVTHFMVLPFNAPNAGQTFTFLVRNHTQNTSVSIVMNSSDPVAAIGSGASLAFADGEEISFEIITSASSGQLNGARWAIELTP